MKFSDISKSALPTFGIDYLVQWVSDNIRNGITFSSFDGKAIIDSSEWFPANLQNPSWELLCTYTDENGERHEVVLTGASEEQSPFSTISKHPEFLSVWEVIDWQMDGDEYDMGETIARGFGDFEYGKWDAENRAYKEEN